MKARICVATYASNHVIDRLAEDLPDDIELQCVEGLYSELAPILKKMDTLGSVDCFVSTGGNADVLESVLKNTPFVRFDPSGYDYVRAVNEAIDYSRDIAIITRHELPEKKILNSTIDANLRFCVYSTSEDLGILLKSLYSEGIRDVIGSAAVVEQAKLHGLRYYLSWSYESFLNCVLQAADLVKKQKQFREKARTLDNLLDFSAEGIIITDANGIITHFNHSAERIMKKKREKIIGQPCGAVIPNTQLYTVMKTRQPEYSRIQDFGNTKVVTNRSPIVSNGEVIGALATFFSVGTIRQASENLMQYQGIESSVPKATFDNILTSNDSFNQMLLLAKSFAKSESNILITGEKSTGKSNLAEAIHNESTRNKEPFIVFNCEAAKNTDYEELLFGSEALSKREDKVGVLQSAGSGTVLIKNINKLPVYVQIQLSDALEHRQIRRAHSNRPVPLNARIIATSSESLEEAVAEKKFSAELFYKVGVLRLSTPALRDRREDIPLLIEAFLSSTGHHHSSSEIEFVSKSARFIEYGWPGNILELKSVIERYKSISPFYNNIRDAVDAALPNKLIEIRRKEIESSPRQEIEKALEMAGGNRVKAAEILGISRTTLWRNMRELGIES